MATSSQSVALRRQRFRHMRSCIWTAGLAETHAFIQSHFQVWRSPSSMRHSFFLDPYMLHTTTIGGGNLEFDSAWICSSKWYQHLSMPPTGTIRFRLQICIYEALYTEVVSRCEQFQYSLSLLLPILELCVVVVVVEVFQTTSSKSPRNLHHETLFYICCAFRRSAKCGKSISVRNNTATKLRLAKSPNRIFPTLRLLNPFSLKNCNMQSLPRRCSMAK